MNYQILWLVLLIAFAGIEGITAGLVSIWFCAGSLVALIATWLGASLPVQIGLFAVVSVAAMALIRPMARKWLHPKMEKTNADRILGQEGVVVESIDNLKMCIRDRRWASMVPSAHFIVSRWCARPAQRSFCRPSGRGESPLFWPLPQTGR